MVDSENPEFRVGGTLVWYYCICERQVWLMSHLINPDEDNPNIDYGRFLQATSYSRTKKEIKVGDNRIDAIQRINGEMVVIEVKKSSRAIQSARMQLAHYLMELEEEGIRARGELRFPEERRREEVVLDDALRNEILRIRDSIKKIMMQPYPPSPKWGRWCRSCAYAELCWA